MICTYIENNPSVVYRRHLIGQKYYNFEAEDICVFINSGFPIKTEGDYVIRHFQEAN